MTRLLFAIVLLAPNATQSSSVSVPELLQAAYEAGWEDRAYQYDDIGVKRLTIEDIETQLKGR